MCPYKLISDAVMCLYLFVTISVESNFLKNEMELADFLSIVFYVCSIIFSQNHKT